MRSSIADRFGTHRIGLVIILLLVGGWKLWLAAGLPASSAFTDDYDYLHQSIHFSEGNWKRAGHPFPKVANTGPAYPLLISPWLLFEGHRLRIFVVFTINILLSTATILFGTLAIWSHSRKGSWLVPAALAIFSPVFVFNFYAMTENLLFTLIAYLAWQVADLESVLRHPARLAGLLLAVALAPLVREPGTAVVPALLLVVWARRRELGNPGWWLLSVGIVVMATGPYLLIHEYLLARGSHAAYLSFLLHMFDARPIATVLAYTAGLAVVQVLYVLLAGGFFTLPLFLALAWQLPAWPKTSARRRLVNQVIFCGTGAVLFIGFCLVHMLRKMNFSPGQWTTIYGRYNDPATLLVLIGGLAGLFAIRSLDSPQRFLLRFLAPVGVGLFFVVHFAAYWMPISQTGLALFTVFSVMPSPAVTVAIMVVTVAGIVASAELAMSQRWRRFVVLAVFMAYHAGSVAVALHMTHDRARRIAYSLEAADWLTANTSTDVRVGFDLRVEERRAPQGVKYMSNVYRALGVAIHPRPAIPAIPADESLTDLDYFFTLNGAVDAPCWPVAWQNRHYVLHSVGPETKEIFSDSFESGDSTRWHRCHQQAFGTPP